jgi:hypothetical protein
MLREALRTYLEAGASRGAAGSLDRVLRDARHPEAGLLERYGEAGGGWHEHEGKRVFIGPVPPTAEIGTRWFDCCDLSLSIQIPQYVPPDELDDLSPEARARALENTAWLSLRPVSRFQFGAFLDVAPIERSVPGALDPQRLLGAIETEPVTRIMCNEASLYLHWFGKLFPSELDFRSARDLLGAVPWSRPSREWAGVSSVDSVQCEVVSAASLESTVDDYEPELFEEGETPADVTFRGVVRVMYGLFTDAQASSRSTVVCSFSSSSRACPAS